ncbi:MAG: ATP-dependent zinc metalloprotease FtsH, partial [Firmicutes bacterium]|nr:ATP-dependent zinc metalloprotease FtsH [Bacillota bacterium]
IPQAEAGKLTVESIKPSAWAGVISWIPTLLLVAIMIFFWTSFMGSGGGNKGMMNFGKSKAKIFKDGNTKVTFKDVAGLDEEKAELEEIVDFLKSPKKYTDLGARIPKGVLLVGPPGTGKTYISKAVAGEAGVPFFSISGSDFVEMFVGVGASRVRDLFDEAKKNAPCIVFIDEIDAVGRRRGAGIGGGNDEREQTLNQLLVEMDGFGINEGIIVLAATNRPDVLDPAILRPGRFDREVTIGTPDIKGREAVFRVHSKNKPLGKDVNIKTLAKRTPGFTPADIENMMNEAALLTARRNGSEIHMEDLEEAITRVIAGPKKKSKVMSDKEKRLTAFHEAGHAVVMRSTPGADPVHQVTIMPRGRAGGFTMQLPEEDKYYMTKGDMLHEIQHLLGGRVAEALVMGDISTGASNDLERATKIAHDMVAKYGMSETIGPLNYSSADEVFLGRDFTSKQNFSEELASKIDKEVHDIMTNAYAETEKILLEHREELHRVAEALLEMETLDADQFEALYTNTSTVEELENIQKEADAARAEKERLEAEKKAFLEAEEKRRVEEQMREAMEKGKRVAVMDEKGNIIIRDASEVRKAREEAQKKGRDE